MRKAFVIALAAAAMAAAWPVSAEKKIKRLSPDVVKTFGGKQKRGVPQSLPKLTPESNPFRTVRKAASDNGLILFEDFSGWNGQDPFWVPEGWTVEHLGECSEQETWRPFMYNMCYPAPIEGNSYYGIFYSEQEQDEWLVAPEVRLGENMELSYWLSLDLVYLYDTDLVDWDTNEFTEKVVLSDLQVLAREKGGEWKVMRDYAEEYMNHTLRELYAESSYEFKKQTLSLDEFSGKDVQVAFRLTGHDGNLIFIDAIGIGLPAIEDICYNTPQNTLYFGLGNNPEMEYLQNDYAIYPVYAPITWENYSEANASFSWLYTDPETHGEATSDDQYELSVAYLPDYSSVATIKNNLYDAPTLIAEAKGMAPTSYRAPYKKFQAGGKAVMTTPYGELPLTMMQFAPERQGYTRISIMDDRLGAYSIPVFGYNEFSDQYWLNYSLDFTYEPMEGNFSHLIGIANIFVPSQEAALVVNGMSVYGWGKIGDDAELTGTIYAVNSDYSADYNTFTVVARSSIKGSDVEAAWDKNSKDFLFLPFHFDEPAVVKASKEHPMFIFMLEGFNSDKVEYFMPLQSKNNSEMDLSVAYMLNEINLSGHVDMDTYYSFKPIRYREGDDYIFPGGAFAIGLDAEYPWLTCEASTVEIGPEESEASVALGSYYDGSALTVEAPEGLVASASERYNECVLTIARAGSDGAPIEGDVTVKGPGVEVTVAVKAASTSGVSSCASEQDGEVYDLSGRKVSSMDAKGIYIVKGSDGKVRKVNLK